MKIKFLLRHNGMVGKAVCRSLRKYGYHNIITRDRTDLDLAILKQLMNFYIRINQILSS